MTVPLARADAVSVRLGLRENFAQFTLLVIVNAFVGAMVGLERSILPAMAEQEFQLAARTAMLSFIVVFGVAKALTNYGAGRLSDRSGRKRLLVAGWLVAVPVPFLLMWAPTWNWVLVANVLLGISQGLTWSTTVIMKIDLVGSRQRGLAMGVNEFAGYVALAASALATGWIASRYGLRPQPFYLGVGFAIIGLALSALLIRETRHHASHESDLVGTLPPEGVPTPRQIFWRTTLVDANLSSVSQAGLVNNLNDGLAWGLFPLVFGAAGMDLAQVGLLAAIYPATWGLAQLLTGALSDRTGRKPLIVWGMWIQAAGIGVVALADTFAGFAVGAVLLGIGTAMVYPTLLAAIGDVAHPSWRASAVGVYRLWRDLGYAIGAVLAGVTADAFGLAAAMWVIAALTFVSGVVSATRMAETLPPGLRTTPHADCESATSMPGPQPHLAVDTHRPEGEVEPSRPLGANCATRTMNTESLPLLQHSLESPSAFTPERLMEAVRAERSLANEPVPPLCVLDFDGDLSDRLAEGGRTSPVKSWACFHTSMGAMTLDGVACGIVPRTIGGPYAVLVAEQLWAAGAKVIVGLTSAGRISSNLPLPSIVVDEAVRDEGTSLHYVPPSATIVTPAPRLAELLTQERGVLAVEMQAASLFAFARARAANVAIVALVSNGVDHVAGQFDTGGHAFRAGVLAAIARAAHVFMTPPTERHTVEGTRRQPQI